MKVMPGIVGQIGQNVADNLFEIGQSAVKGTAGAMADIASESIEQISLTPSQVDQNKNNQQEQEKKQITAEKQKAAQQRYEEVKAELARYIERKKKQEAQIAEEMQMKEQQNKVAEEKQHDSWVSKMINRAATTAERGRMVE